MAAVADVPAGVTARYEAVIGIEIHVQLKTVSKMFCSCSTDLVDAPPNSRTCPVCLGMPGTLPVANRRAVELVLATGMAIGATITPVTRWERKNYFYPDLPKGYQISQYELPLAAQGRLTFDTSDGPFTVRITRAHLEEDTARLQHVVDEQGIRRASLIDFNRSGIPLMEVVTEPDIRTGEQARLYAEELRLLLRAIGASEAEMENGQMRVEANVSIRPRGVAEFGTRVEVKNMNSFRSVERAIGYEIERQAHMLDDGQPLHQETRGWDDGRGVTYLMRAKETSDDYRYFPEPDLPPLRTDPAWLDEIRATLPELPSHRRERYQADLGLSAYDASVLVADAAAAMLFEEALAASPSIAPKSAANWVTGEYLRLLKSSPDGGHPSGAQLADLVRRVADGELSATNAKEVFARHFATGQAVAAIVAAMDVTQISDRSALEAAVEEVIKANPAAVADYHAGKQQVAGFLVGRVMKATRGQANAQLAREVLLARLQVEGEG